LCTLGEIAVSGDAFQAIYLIQYGLYRSKIRHKKCWDFSTFLQMPILLLLCANLLFLKLLFGRFEHIVEFVEDIFLFCTTVAVFPLTGFGFIAVVVVSIFVVAVAAVAIAESSGICSNCIIGSGSDKIVNVIGNI